MWGKHEPVQSRRRRQSQRVMDGRGDHLFVEQRQRFAVLTPPVGSRATQATVIDAARRSCASATREHSGDVLCHSLGFVNNLLHFIKEFSTIFLFFFHSFFPLQAQLTISKLLTSCFQGFLQVDSTQLLFVKR